MNASDPGLISPDLFVTLSSDTASNQSRLSDISSVYSEDENGNYSDYQLLKILSLSVGWLLNKSESPDFDNFISLYDIVCIQESHFDIDDPVSFRVFKLLPTMVRSCAKNSSGGIAILVRDKIFDTIEVVQNSDENFYWFTCSLCSDVLFCVLYIAPEGNSYSDIANFHSLESDLLELCQTKNFQICLLGDFNARTSNDSDLVAYDENLEQFLLSDSK